MKMAIGTDHAGLDFKTALVEYLKDLNIDIEDFGAHKMEPADDYPDYARAVAEAVASGACTRGILICGSGIGMSIAANRVPGARAALCLNQYMARLSRTHNDANILVVAGRITAPEHLYTIVDTWLDTEFSGDSRHTSRIGKMEQS